MHQVTQTQAIYLWHTAYAAKLTRGMLIALDKRDYHSKRRLYRKCRETCFLGAIVQICEHLTTSLQPFRAVRKLIRATAVLLATSEAA
jgi:hypothetical protein